MKLPLITPTLSLLFILMTLSACNGPQVKPPSTKGGLETGQYRNVFVEAGYSPAEVDAKVQEVFNDVFRGPNKAYFEVGDSMGYVSDIKNNDVRTEGMSYGMMIAVQFGEKDIFDRLWRWSQRYMQHQDGPREGYFAWSCRTDGTPTVSVLPAMANSTTSPPCSLPPTAGETTPASTTKPKHSALSTAL